ncbi:MAG: alpha/beta hydrolase [Aquabacterium sp.]
MSTWILLRGLTREQGHWGDFVSQLKAALPAGDQVLTPDLPGNGTLCNQRSPIRVEDMMQACRQMLLAQGHRPPYQVVAMSLGAMVTVAWADHHPQEIDHCVLINTSLRPYSPFWQRLRPRQYPIILKLLLTNAGTAQWEDAILRMTTRHPVNAQAMMAHWLALRQQHPVSVPNGLRQLWAASRYRAPASKPGVPMLLLNSQGDQLVNPACSAVLAQHWQVPMLRHPTAGHDLPQDAGPWVVQQVLAWLAQPSSQRAQAHSAAQASQARNPNP